MFQVIACRKFTGSNPEKKSSFGKTFYFVDVVDTNGGGAAVDVFSNQEFTIGSYVEARAKIINHKLGYELVQIMEKK